MIIEKDDESNNNSNKNLGNSLEKETENIENNGFFLSKSKSELISVDEESELSLHDPLYKIKKNISLNNDLENDKSIFIHFLTVSQ